MIEIRRLNNNEIIHSGDFKSMRECVEDAVRKDVSLWSANLQSVDLRSANLESANLQSANLRSANLQSADLRSANLQSTNLRSADLWSADLRSADLQLANLQLANLQSANLREANLRSAHLWSAHLRSANLQLATLPDGLSWETYCTETVPALLTAGGKSLEDILSTGCWDCNDWENGPMHVAFGIDRPEDGPPLLIPRIREFAQFFDAGLIPEVA